MLRHAHSICTCCRVLAPEMLWGLQIERYGEQYQDLSWGPIIGLIKEDQAAAGKQHHNASKERAVIKERFTTINTTLQARAPSIVMCPACLHLKQGMAACGTLHGPNTALQAGSGMFAALLHAGKLRQHLAVSYPEHCSCMTGETSTWLPAQSCRAQIATQPPAAGPKRRQSTDLCPGRA